MMTIDVSDETGEHLDRFCEIYRKSMDEVLNMLMESYESGGL